MTATAYAPGSEDNGKWGDLTYMGGTVKKGVAAVDPRVIPTKEGSRNGYLLFSTYQKVYALREVRLCFHGGNGVVVTEW